MLPYVHCSIIYNSLNLEAVQMPISRQVDQKTEVHLRSGIHLDVKIKFINFTFHHGSKKKVKGRHSEDMVSEWLTLVRLKGTTVNIKFF